jgi:hypothetical protein
VIGTIIRDHLLSVDQPQLRLALTPHQRQTLLDIAACGTEACGLHRQRCDHCGDERMVANTCGNRSCPHCQAGERRAWVAAREAELLPCGYFHAVLTLPSELRGLARAFPLVLDLLLQAAPDAIHHLAAQPNHLGAEVGSVGVLHTWTRDLRWHPHAHLIVTGGGLRADGTWAWAKRQGRERRPFLLPVAALRVALQRRLMRLLLDAYDRGDFQLGPVEAFPMLASRAAFRAALGRMAQKTWCIRIEPPFGSPQVLLRYLGRYINRVALAPQRIIGYDRETGTVTIAWTKNDDARTPQTLTLSVGEFITLFAQHILPQRFVRIRFRGLWATAHRRTKLERAREILRQLQPACTAAHPDASAPPAHALAATHVDDPRRCPVCGIGTYHRLPGGHRSRQAERHRRIRDLALGMTAMTAGASMTA